MPPELYPLLWVYPELPLSSNLADGGNYQALLTGARPFSHHPLRWDMRPQGPALGTAIDTTAQGPGTTDASQDWRGPIAVSRDCLQPQVSVSGIGDFLPPLVLVSVAASRNHLQMLLAVSAVSGERVVSGDLLQKPVVA